ncbi:hypothetical protein V496_06486 [Pseudogymnoascus sp. VKM F-4515 (FW-2607)]|nr:hypothetical protein V496_06486 [Pseudogymnoascus sp. VKM F-4515 (FW-2607)]
MVQPFSEHTLALIPPSSQEAQHLRKLELLESSLSKDNMPTYEVRGSKKKLGQQKAIEWLTAYAKAQFSDYFSEILCQWGVKDTHKGSCILVPADWAALDPIKMAEQFEFKNCPLKGAMSPNFSLGDHITNLTRAIAWFGQWPRTGIELDNFLGAGPFKPMQGSHLCHHQLCIIHLTYESAEANNNRKSCHEEARFIRGEGFNIPPYCNKHQPPCLMQHAALTTFESFLIQFSVLRQAQGLPASPALARPRWHQYKTFEYQLPLQFVACPLAVTANPCDLVNPGIKASQKPELCYYSIGVLIPKEFLLEELWREEQQPYNGKAPGSCTGWVYMGFCPSMEATVRQIVQVESAIASYTWGKRHSPT